MVLLKIIGKRIPVFDEVVEFDFFASQRVTDEDAEHLIPLFGQMYANPVNALVGINASGKTKSLEFISFVLSLLRGDSLNGKPFLYKLSENDAIETESYFYLKETECVYRLVTSLFAEKTPDGKLACHIAKEALYEKKVQKIRTKKAMLDFDGIAPFERAKDEQYLSDDVSMAISYAKNYRDRLVVFDLVGLTDRNFSVKSGEIPSELLMFLDPSIERLEVHDDNDARPTVIKFKNVETPIVLKGTRGLDLYLSSGTIRGTHLFSAAYYVLRHGGYMIVDEIENHFNMEIVKALIRFFMDKETNKGGGTLIFSTHQPVLLDEFDRNDSITILRHEGRIRASNLKTLLDRNDLKKSDVYESDFLHGTAPSYERFMALRAMITNKHD